MCTVQIQPESGIAVDPLDRRRMPDAPSPSWLSAILRLRCNRCRIGRLFPSRTLSFQRPFDMYTSCPKCGLNYWPEPGFYYGAMFMSSILLSFPFLLFVIVLHWIFGVGLEASMLLLCVAVGLTFVYSFRVARSAWLGMTVKYDPSVSQRALAGDPDVEPPGVR